jgi:hypothetical protein
MHGNVSRLPTNGISPGRLSPVRRVWNLTAANTRKAKRAAKAGNGSNGSGKAGNGPPAESTPAQRLWSRAEVLSPKTPWRAVRDGLGVHRDRRESPAHGDRAIFAPAGARHGLLHGRVGAGRRYDEPCGRLFTLARGRAPCSL